jgi:hypothetical protein
LYDVMHKVLTFNMLHIETICRMLGLYQPI